MACGEKKPLLVLKIRSGLKLEQVGWEFSNVGIVKTLSSEEFDDNRHVNANQFHRALAFSRVKNGHFAKSLPGGHFGRAMGFPS